MIMMLFIYITTASTKIEWNVTNGRNTQRSVTKNKSQMLIIFNSPLYFREVQFLQGDWHRH
jgi:hypothetical protein